MSESDEVRGPGCGRILTFEEIEESDAGRVGGKAANLARLTRAGLPVPQGFCVLPPTGQAGSPIDEAGGWADLLRAYRELGAGRVAVRSSATAEDSPEASFAGQQETYLNVEGEEALVAAVKACRASLASERSRAYQQRQGVSESDVAMAVVVQGMVDSEVSGVLFTRDPLDASGETLRLEASWGLGEAIVSGRVTPDSFQVDRETGRVRDRRVAEKGEMVTRDGVRPVPEDLRRAPCLTEAEVLVLTDLARRVEALYGSPQDVEWALADGKAWLLQARPITAMSGGERERARRGEIERLRALADPQGTVWSRYSLAEVVPEPLPMTWSLLRRFMSGSGGYGLMYRDLGYDPDPELDEAGVLDLVCGRPYFNLSRERRIYFRDFPYGYSFEALKADPQRAIHPTPETRLESAPRGFWLRLPRTIVRMVAADRRVKALRRSFHQELRERIAPEFLAEVRAARSEPLDALPAERLVERFVYWQDRTLNRFARESLKPSVFAGLALAALEQDLAKRMPASDPGRQEKARTLARALVARARPDPDADVSHCLQQAAAGEITFQELVDRVGHRGSLEMELAQPRWREQPETLASLVAGMRADGPAASEEGQASDTGSANHWGGEGHGGADRTRMAPPEEPVEPALAEELRWARLYLGLRETAKHWLMAGYEEIRRCLVELDRRYGLEGGIFYLEAQELPELVAGADLSARIWERRRARDLLLSLDCPRVLFSDNLEAIGRPEAGVGQSVLTGAAVSGGVVEGPALVAHRPDQVPAEARDFVLVCPSTDPGWSAVFLRARGLVMETGGVLSHGAIVAREFGIPAVVNLPGLFGQVGTGMTLRVDGDLGVVTVLESGGK